MRVLVLTLAALAGAASLPACTGELGESSEPRNGGDPSPTGDGTAQSDPTGPGEEASAAGDSTESVDIPAGVILFAEPFEDTDFSSRGWYDGPNGTLSTVEHVAGSTASFECTFQQGERGCAGGAPGRHAIVETESVYLSFWIKHSANWVGSGVSYHPHEFHFVTNKDDDYVGPAGTHLTTYTETVGGRPRMALQDSSNVDDACILRNDGVSEGCGGGDVDSYPFTEARSVCSCNGLRGDFVYRDCYFTGTYWYSSRAWGPTESYFRDEAGPYRKNDWHFIEAYFEMNTIEGGVGVPNGKIRYVYDGQTLISHDHILMRTAVNQDMRFDQFLTGFYIGPGSPVTQTLWIDNLTVATGRP